MIEKAKYWFLFFLNYKNFFELISNKFLGKRNKKICLRNNLKIFGRETTPLLVVVDEVFLFKRYTPKYLLIKKGDIVVDIGAHVGVFSLMASRQGASKVFAYEPDLENVKMIQMNVKFNNLKKIFVRNLAISNKRANIKLFLAKGDASNTLFKNFFDVTSDNFQIIKSVKLEDVFRLEKIKKIDFLKIDCEGAEGLIFKSTPAKIWKNINKIAMEYHDTVSPLSHQKISKYLLSQGYLVKIMPLGNGQGYLYAYKH